MAEAARALREATEPYDAPYAELEARIQELDDRGVAAARRWRAGDTSSEVAQELNFVTVAGRDADRKLREIAYERARTRGAALRDTASGLNPFGKPSPGFSSPWDPLSSRYIRRFADWPVASLLPADWLAASADHSTIRAHLSAVGPLVAESGGGYARAGTPAARHYTGREDTAYLDIEVTPSASNRIRARTLLHEMCHRMEDAVPGLVEHEREHHRARVPGAWDPSTGNPITALNDERSSPDGDPPFFHPYLKQRYSPQTDTVEGYEILPMSVESLFFGPRQNATSDVADDPATERFVLSLLLGSRLR